MELKEIAEILEANRNEKLTLSFINDFGFTSTIHINKMTKIELGSYAQFREALELQFMMPRKRKPRGYRFFGGRTFNIYKGHVTFNDRVNESVIREDDTCKVISLGRCFDRNAFQNIQRTAGVEPIATYHKEW